MTCSLCADRGRDHAAGGVEERNQFLSWRPRSSAIKAELRQYFAHVDTLYVQSRRTRKLVAGVLPWLKIILEGVHLHTRAMLHDRRSNQEAFKKEQDMLDSLDPELRVSGSTGRARDQRDPPVSEAERDAVLNQPCCLSRAWPWLLQARILLDANVQLLHHLPLFAQAGKHGRSFYTHS